MVTVTVTVTSERMVSLEERGGWFTGKAKGESQGVQVGESGVRSRSRSEE
jgi:hypothetical protein